MKSKTQLLSSTARALATDIVPELLRAAILLVDFAGETFPLLRLIAGVAAVTSAIGGLLMLAWEKGWFSHDAMGIPPARLHKSSPREFKDLRGSTKCPFAATARLRGGTLAGFGTLERRILRLVRRLVETTRVGRERRLDGFMIRLPFNLVKDLDALSRTVNRVLRTLAEHDPTENNCFNTNILAHDWQFSFNGTRFFVTAFAPFYGNQHSRFSGSKDWGFIYLQPEYSFDHHGVFAGNPERERLKKYIREAFAAGGTPYDVALIIQPVEAYKYVKPLKSSDAPVEWWNAK